MTWDYQRISISISESDALTDKNHKRWLEQIHTTEIILRKLKSSLALILGDEVGMGKTWIGLLTAMSVAKNKRVLILTPNKVLANQWKEQFRDLVNVKFPKEEHEDLLNRLVSEDYYHEFRDLLKDAKKQENGIYITTFSAIDPTDPNKVYKNNMSDSSFFELLVIDEGHKFKNSFTERFQIFKATKGEKYRAPLNNQFRRLLIMTATPFQLNHEDLKVILGIAESSSGDRELADKLQVQISRLIDSLNSYKLKLNQFERKFQKITSEKDLKTLEALVENPDSIVSAEGTIKDIARSFTELIKTKDALNEDMKAFVIRNTKSKDKRKNKPRAIEIDDSSKFTFFLGDSLQRSKLREKNTNQQVALLTSSFGRFDEFLLKDNTTLAQNHYASLVATLKDSVFGNRNHPKIEVIVNHAFENWLKGDKTLIFAFYVKTVKEINDKLEEKITAYINNERKRFDEVEAKSFLNRLGNSDKIDSLVFRDNPFKVTLLPLLQEIDNSEKFLDDFIRLDKDDFEDLVRFLAKMKYPTKDANYFKLLTGLSHIYFSKFYNKYKKRIPDNLDDDFEEIMDPEAFLFRDIFKHHELPDVEAESKRMGAIRDNVLSTLTKPDAIKEILFYPTIWEKHREGLENVHIQKRLAFTEVVWSYLTTDEFIFMDLLNNKSDIPEAKDIPHLYSNSSVTNRESTYKRIVRLLESAGKMDEKNLGNLVSDIAYRYNPNKRNIGRMVVETVSGENSADEKHRSVTAFKTPLPPYILISTAVLAEGVDLHKECDDIIHYDHEWNPANLEQKIGRLDRVGCKGEKTKKIDIHYPYLEGTQDQKAFNIVMARKSWFGAVMGEKYEDKWKADSEGELSIPLPESFQLKLVMKLGNDSH